MNKINNLFIELSREIQKEKEELEKNKNEYEIEKNKFLELSKKVESILDSEPITLYIGGGSSNKYITRLSVLRRFPDSFFGVMFSERNSSLLKEFNNKKNNYFIDRDGEHFGIILNFLRGEKIRIPQNTSIIKKLIYDCKYYCLPELEELLKKEYIKIRPNLNYNNNDNYMPTSSYTYKKY